MRMWWVEIRDLGKRLSAANPGSETQINAEALVEDGAVLDDRDGPIVIGAGTRICAGARLRGPIQIGADCFVGNQSMLRGPVLIGDGVKIGFSTELKQALVGDNVSIGPMCFVADSKVDEGAYLGAMVRTSNHRLDGKDISVRQGDADLSTGLEKLGCWIGARTSLGIQVIVLPGRVVPESSLFEPRITISRNYPTGHYRVKQDIESV
jgi:UDP-N-acetylglucosamine diphosphorylase / glucose-1-phosphate thymidylyltransferase / UDP-N-acetylgalactosamine diphosphorylase / glucosamine-1-phosphate N-acetyltransferase / galactosamine-1-phosphate N-acetyltransferase